MATNRNSKWVLFSICVAALAGAPALEAAELPRPFGVGITVYGQSQDYDIDRLSFNAPGLVVNPDVLEIDNQIQEVNLKLDYWVAPFLNVFAIVGQLDGKTRVDLSAARLPIPLTNITIDYDGEVYGGGITAAVGGERWFASLTGIYTDTNLSGDFNSTVTALVVSPKVGLHGDRGAVWIGAMYQQAEEEHSGKITVPFVGAVDFAVKLQEKDSTNFLVGMAAGLTEHWHLELEGGTAGRLSGSVGLTYRF